MPISTKHLGSSSKTTKLIKRAKKMYPDMDWMAQLPNPEILKDYGDGIVLTGRKGLFEATYFILHEDPRKDNWIVMIANQVEEKINGTD